MPRKRAKIAVLLASYNGEKYIEQQITSILEQDYLGHIEVIIRDDGSSDDTKAIVKKIEVTSQTRSIHLIANNTQKHGHKANFNALAEYAKGLCTEYFAFADQDDVWHPNKISDLMEEMVRLESLSPSTPVLVHSDLNVVDEELNQIANSFVKFQGLPDPRTHVSPKFLYQNVVTGCTTLFNKSLLSIATPLPPNAVIHDWWFGLCAYHWGDIGYIATPLIEYRQHGRNAIGAKSFKEQRSIYKSHLYKTLMSFPKNFLMSINQSQELLKKSSNLPLNREDSEWLEYFSQLKDVSFTKRIWAISKLFGDKSVKEKVYLFLVLAILPWLG